VSYIFIAIAESEQGLKGQAYIIVTADSQEFSVCVPGVRGELQNLRKSTILRGAMSRYYSRDYHERNHP
jgi:hypothetical protein